MQYGLRHYETSQRLWWFVLILLCLAVAYPASGGYVELAARLQPPHLEQIKPEILQSLDFWNQRHWIAASPCGRLIVFLALTAWYFLIFRALWLLVQWIGKWLMAWALKNEVEELPESTEAESPGAALRPKMVLPADRLRKIVSPWPLRIVFNAHRRLYLLLNGVSRVLSSEALMQRETRMETIDWQLAGSTWEPYRWILRLLPLLAVAQGAWIFYLSLQPVLDGSRELQSVPGIAVTSLLPVVQMIALSVGLALAQGLLQRLEHYYLAKLDALFFDQLLARLPLQSSDTLLLLNALEKHFQQLKTTLKRLEQKLGD